MDNIVRCEFDAEAGVLTCFFRGRLDAPASEAAAAAVAARIEALASPARVVFDLGEVVYIASAFLRFCLLTGSSAAAGFAIVNTSPFTKKVFTVAGFDRVLDIS
ncbi:MAG TPA: STAS domain-containing protein [bacterium]|nr:STAS domain-containing protein [bacterium]HPJ71338.1 STAS domain-containing protein [bacterium]HPQ65226.1 STAS domain-containing protein [bacterium]